MFKKTTNPYQTFKIFGSDQESIGFRLKYVHCALPTISASFVDIGALFFKMSSGNTFLAQRIREIKPLRSDCFGLPD
jgi:hypothetical protein